MKLKFTITEVQNYTLDGFAKDKKEKDVIIDEFTKEEVEQIFSTTSVFDNLVDILMNRGEKERARHYSRWFKELFKKGHTLTLTRQV